MDFQCSDNTLPHDNSYLSKTVMSHFNPSPQVYHHRLDGAALSTILASSQDVEVVNKGRKVSVSRRTEEMRQKHNLISQKGRQRINEEITKLKQLLPECRDVECNKAAILQCAVKNLERFTKCTNNLFLSVQNLEKEKKRMWRACHQMAVDISQLTNRPFQDVLSNYNVEPPMYQDTIFKEEYPEEMHIPPPPKKHRNQEDDVINNCWPLDNF